MATIAAETPPTIIAGVATVGGLMCCCPHPCQICSSYAAGGTALYADVSGWVDDVRASLPAEMRPLFDLIPSPIHSTINTTTFALANGGSPPSFRKFYAQSTSATSAGNLAAIETAFNAAIVGCPTTDYPPWDSTANPTFLLGFSDYDLFEIDFSCPQIIGGVNSVIVHIFYIASILIVLSNSTGAHNSVNLSYLRSTKKTIPVTDISCSPFTWSSNMGTGTGIASPVGNDTYIVNVSVFPYSATTACINTATPAPRFLATLSIHE